MVIDSLPALSADATYQAAQAQVAAIQTKLASINTQIAALAAQIAAGPTSEADPVAAAQAVIAGTAVTDLSAVRAQHADLRSQASLLQAGLAKSQQQLSALQVTLSATASQAVAADYVGICTQLLTALRAAATARAAEAAFIAKGRSLGFTLQLPPLPKAHALGDATSGVLAATIAELAAFTGA